MPRDKPTDIKIDTMSNMRIFLSKKNTYYMAYAILSLNKKSGANLSINTNDIISYSPNVKNILWNKNRDMIQGMYQHALEQWDWASTKQKEDAKYIISGTKAGSTSELAWKI